MIKVLVMKNRKKIYRLLIAAMMIMTLFGCKQKQADSVKIPVFTRAAESELDLKAGDIWIQPDLPFTFRINTQFK